MQFWSQIIFRKRNNKGLFEIYVACSSFSTSFTSFLDFHFFLFFSLLLLFSTIVHLKAFVPLLFCYFLHSQPPSSFPDLAFSSPSYSSLFSDPHSYIHFPQWTFALENRALVTGHCETMIHSSVANSFKAKRLLLVKAAEKSLFYLQCVG